jgi:hypothetical protein
VNDAFGINPALNDGQQARRRAVWHDLGANSAFTFKEARARWRKVPHPRLRGLGGPPGRPSPKND